MKLDTLLSGMACHKRALGLIVMFYTITSDENIIFSGTGHRIILNIGYQQGSVCCLFNLLLVATVILQNFKIN